MKFYELTYTTSSNISVEEQKKLSERVASFLQTPPIRQSSFGFLTSLYFSSEPEKIEEFEKKLKEEPQIEKYMILKKAAPGAKVKTPRKIRVPQKKEKKIEKPKVELEEIEKKLDEILKD